MAAAGNESVQTAIALSSNGVSVWDEATQTWRYIPPPPTPDASPQWTYSTAEWRPAVPPEAK